MNLDDAVIDSINFGILSPEEIKAMSVAEIFSNKLVGPNSIYDEALGPIDNHKICVSCGCDNKTCPGHFGHIALNYKIIHPLFYRITLMFLKCHCIKCSSCLLTPEQLKLSGLMKYQREQRFLKTIEKCEKVDVCPSCQSHQPKILYVASESNIYMNYKTKDESIKTQLTEQEIENIFTNISSKSIRLLGLNPDLTHPRNLILHYLPVLPPIDRPYIMSDSVTCDDDLTLQYLEIIKTNNHLGDDGLSETKRSKYIQSLKFRIKCLFDNSQDKAKHTNGRPVKSFKKRITGKEGQIRNNLMGKRVNKSARTVIGPDPTLGMQEIALPPEMSKILTYPERVTNYNIDKMTKLINQDKANFVERDGQRINLRYAMFRKGTELLYGDKIIRTIERNGKKNTKELIYDDNNHFELIENDKIIRNGKELDSVEYPARKQFSLRIGDIVQRHLQNNDIVLLNRQPTLHKGSMLAQHVRVDIPAKTIRMNLAITKTFNADFDGDEMNIHAPSTPECVAELQELSASKHNLISAQSSKPNITIVQDALLGNYLMTLPEKYISKAHFFQISCAARNMSTDMILNKIQHIRRVLKFKSKPIKAFSGRGLFSLLLPNDFNYESTNKACASEPTVRIYRGVLYEGVINKSILGGGHNTLIQTLMKEYSDDVAVEFINNVQFIAYSWLLQYGFSVGIADCIATKTKEIDHIVTKSFVEAQGIEETTQNPLICEVKVAATLSKARDNGMKIAKEALGSENNFVHTVTSGSKGDWFNIAQITGVLGQQNFSGARIPKTLTGCERTLPFYPCDSKDPGLTKELEYESRGFIRNSFIHGLNPREFWFHSITGREGVTDTAMKTAQSGYIQRRMVKVGEDVAIKYDGTVRNNMESIIQFKYGDDGLDPTKTIIVDQKPQICNVARLAERINLSYE